MNIGVYSIEMAILMLKNGPFFSPLDLGPKSLLGQVEQVDTCRADVVGGGF